MLPLYIKATISVLDEYLIWMHAQYVYNTCQSSHVVIHLIKFFFFRQIYNGIRMIPNLAQNPVTATIQTTKRGVLGMHVT